MRNEMRKSIMKHITKHIMAILLPVLLVAAMAPMTAHAAGNVSYEGKAEGFVFSPGSSQSPTDLFPGLKNAMPGDTLTDSVTITNNGGKEARVSMRALESKDQSPALLPMLTLKVTKQDGSALAEGTADQPGNLADWVALATLKPGESITLNLSLEVPIELGDEYQDAAGFINWQFMVEEAEDPTKAKTGDDSPVLLIGGICAAALLVAVIAGLARRRK